MLIICTSANYVYTNAILFTIVYENQTLAPTEKSIETIDIDKCVPQFEVYTRHEATMLLQYEYFA